MNEESYSPNVSRGSLLVVAHRIDGSLKQSVQELSTRFELRVFFLEGGPELTPVVKARRLTITATGGRMRRTARRAMRKLSGPQRRMRQASRVDPGFREALHGVDRVMAWDRVADEVLDAVGEQSPDTAIVTSCDAASFVIDQRAWGQLYDALDNVQGADGIEAALLALRDRLETPVLVVEPVDPTPMYGFLDDLLRDEQHRAVLEAVTVVARLPGLQANDAVLRSVRAVSELMAYEGTSIEVIGTLTACLAAADAAIEEECISSAAVLASVALRLAFHPRSAMHSPDDDHNSAVFAALQRARVWPLLTSPLATPSNEPPRMSRRNVHVVVSSGTHTSSAQAIFEALDAPPQTVVKAVKPVEIGLNRGALRADADLIGLRLRLALGLPVTEPSAVAPTLETADVVVVDAADKNAVLWSLRNQNPYRLVVRVHGSDVAHWWIHLVDWSCVFAVVVDDERIAGIVTDVLRERLEATRCHVVGCQDADRIRKIALGDLGHLYNLTASHLDDDALEFVEQLLVSNRVTLPLLRQASISTHLAGAMTLRLEVLEKHRELRDDERIRRLIRRQCGRLRETSPGWSPTIRGPIRPTVSIPGKILHVLKVSAPYRQSGYSVRSLSIVVAQQQHGLNPIGVTALDFPETTDCENVARRESVEGVEHVRLLREDVPDAEPVDAYLDEWATALAEVVQEERPAVIHVHSGHRGFEPALVALAVADAMSIPLVYEVRGFFEAMWSSDLQRAERGETYARRRETEERCMRRADAVVTLGEAMRDDIVSRGIAPARVHIVPNGVNLTAFEPQARRPELTARLGLADQFVFGYISSLDHYREGHELLIEAAVLLRQRGIPATALIVGDGRRLDQLRDFAKSLSAQDFVCFTGRVEHGDVPQYYAQCDVFVIPRVDERAARLVTPLKPFEAMAAGVPLVVSDLPALQEIVGNGERGISFDTGNAESLASTLEELHHHPSRGAAYARCARIWVQHERSWEKNAARYVSIYASLRHGGRQ